MIPYIGITIDLWPDEKTGPVLVTGHTYKTTGATDTHDQEENAVRLAEQMVHEAFRRLREKNIS